MKTSALPKSPEYLAAMEAVNFVRSTANSIIEESRQVLLRCEGCSSSSSRSLSRSPSGYSTAMEESVASPPITPPTQPTTEYSSPNSVLDCPEPKSPSPSGDMTWPAACSILFNDFELTEADSAIEELRTKRGMKTLKSSDDEEKLELRRRLAAYEERIIELDRELSLLRATQEMMKQKEDWMMDYFGSPLFSGGSWYGAAETNRIAIS